MQPAVCNKLNFPNTMLLSVIMCMVLFTVNGQQPYRFDNVLYKAVYWNEATKLMKENQNYLLIDVRTPGEYADTSSHTHLNMGHLKGAVNINIDSFDQHIAELKKYSNKKIFLYCSHSQRSRRVSKLLADNGFQNVYNINGGMSVANESGARAFPLKSSILVNGNLYKNIASTDAVEMIQNKDALIIDVRSEEGFSSKDSVFSRNLGRIKNAVNIPSNGFVQKFKALNVPKTKTILVYDLGGQESTDIATEIARLGYANVFNLFEGLEALLNDNYLSPVSVKKLLVNPAPFEVVSTREAINLLSKPNDFFVIDARSAEEFNNKAQRTFLNVGRLKNANNITAVEGLAPVVDKLSKHANILVYGSYSGNNDVDLVKALIEKGYRNVHFLYQGIGRFAWSCFNIENCKDGIQLLTDHEGLY
jgi:rhodanese-related sulfurtransferase